MITDDYIIQTFFGKSGRLNGNHSTIEYLKEHSPECLSYLETRFDDSESLRETFLRIYFKVEHRPKCPICGDVVKWRGKRNKLFADTCCKGKCYCKYRESIMMEKYGITNFGGLPETIEKIRNTKKEKYGDEKYCNKEKRYETNIKKYGSRAAVNEEIIQKRKATSFLHYGVEVPSQSEVVKEKMVNTCLRKYGVTNYRKSDECLKKIINTKRLNGTVTSSQYEKKVYEWLCEYFGINNIVCQYKDERYKNPKNGHTFHCDFYVKSMDLFIELQFYWAHGKHPFDKKSEEDLRVLENLKEKIKNKPIYGRMIQSWTIDDVMKRNVAKEKNLNYIEIFDTKITKNKLIQIIKNYGNI